MVPWLKPVLAMVPISPFSLGLSGDDPVTFDVSPYPFQNGEISAIMKKILLHGRHEVDFDPQEDIEFFISESLPFHPNALTFLVTLSDGNQIAETYYSVGGGFVVKEDEEPCFGTQVSIAISY